MRIRHYQLLLVIGASFASGIHYTDVRQKKRETAQIIIAKNEEILKTKERLYKEVSVLKPKDKYRLVDCDDDVFYGGEMPVYSFLKMFDGQKDPLSGFIESRGWPLFVHLAGHEEMTDDTLVLMAFRGDTAGVHRSMVTPQIQALYENYANTMMFMPGTYVSLSGTQDLEKSILQSVCHKRFYPSRGVYISNDWPAFVNGGAWQMYTRLLGEKAHIYIFSYSSGGHARNEFIDTVPDPENGTGQNLTKFADARVHLIDGMLDVETNVDDRHSQMNLAKFLTEIVDKNPQKFYYAACALDAEVIENSIFLIRTLHLFGAEMPNGVIRYQNRMGNIYIDILTRDTENPYIHARINLKTQTIFHADDRIKKRLSKNHYSIIPYAYQAFKSLTEERGILKPKPLSSMPQVNFFNPR